MYAVSSPVIISLLHNKQESGHIDLVGFLDLKTFSTWNIGFYISVSWRRHTLKLRLTLWGKSASYICNPPCCPSRGGLSERSPQPFTWQRSKSSKF